MSSPENTKDKLVLMIKEDYYSPSEDRYVEEGFHYISSILWVEAHSVGKMENRGWSVVETDEQSRGV